MNFDYNLSPLQILTILDCQPAPDFQPDESLPQTLNDFLSRTFNNPLFKMSELWQPDKFYFSYDDIGEWIEENESYFTEFPEERKATQFDPFAQRPRAEWPQLMDNYLVIGSDYYEHAVRFAIKEADLQQENPPVYVHYEEDDVQTWFECAATLTDFLMYVLGSVISGALFANARAVLEKAGWVYTKCDKPENVGKWYKCFGRTKVACGYDAERHALISLMEHSSYEGYLISRK